MNIKKAYQMLVVVLFFAFISLISRSIIYLILSIAIATMIISLLRSAKKTRSAGGATLIKPKVAQDENVRLHNFLIGSIITGLLIVGYGSLFFKENTIFHQIITVPNNQILAIILIVVGFTIVLSSVYFMIREMLGVGFEKKQQVLFCGHCGSKNKRDHTYCSSCGNQLK